MIKAILVIIVSFMFNNIKKMDIKEEYIKEQMKLFIENIKKESLISVIDDEVYVVFNFNTIEEIKNDIFENAIINKENETSFILKVKINESIFSKEIKMKIFIKRGDLYV